MHNKLLVFSIESDRNEQTVQSRCNSQKLKKGDEEIIMEKKIWVNPVVLEVSDVSSSATTGSAVADE